MPERMSRADALEYYTEKLRKVFGIEVSPRDFIKSDDYFDYHEMLRKRKKIHENNINAKNKRCA